MSEFLHVAVIDKFLAEFIEFMADRFEGFESRHRFIVLGADPRFALPARGNVEVIAGRGRHVRLWREMQRARRVFLHGLFDPAITRILAVQPHLLRKSLWLIWGGELYDDLWQAGGVMQTIDRWTLRHAIREVAGMATHIPGDIEFARQRFGSKGTAYDCLLYPSNVFERGRPSPQCGERLRVLIGNSATETNRHFELFEQLAALQLPEALELIAPLSYGDMAYARRVEAKGRELFGERFVGLTHFIRRDEYNELLGTVDVAFFNHRRQQAAGNIVHLAGRGKKVYLHPDSPIWSALQAKGITVFDIRHIELTPIDPAIAQRNTERVSEYYSTSVLERQWRALTEDLTGEQGSGSHSRGATR